MSDYVAPIDNASSPPKKPPTMKDIARIAGVAQSTVSRILNETSVKVPISAQTRERVLVVARELGYRPNPFARGLRGAASMMLGVIVRDVMDPFFAVAIDALAAEARSRGYSVVLGHAHQQGEEALVLAGLLEARQCDAIVLLGDLRSDEDGLIAELITSGNTVIEVWRGRSSRFPSVNVDNRAGVELALQHLVDLGHTRIGFVGDARLADMEERRAAFIDGTSGRDLDLDGGYVHAVSNAPQSGADALRVMRKLPNPPTAIIASTDVLAVGVLHGAYAEGLAVPHDVSVVGFDDILMSAFTVPPLTTVHMPIREMMALVVEMAVAGSGAEADGDSPTREQRVFIPRLVVRGSTGPPAGT